MAKRHSGKGGTCLRHVFRDGTGRQTGWQECLHKDRPPDGRPLGVGGERDGHRFGWRKVRFRHLLIFANRRDSQSLVFSHLVCPLVLRRSIIKNAEDAYAAAACVPFPRKGEARFFLDSCLRRNDTRAPAAVGMSSGIACWNMFGSRLGGPVRPCVLAEALAVRADRANIE